MKRNWQGMDFGGSAMLKRVRREFGFAEVSPSSEAIIIRKPFSFKFNVQLIIAAIIIIPALFALVYLLWGQNGLFSNLGLLSK